MENGDSKDRSHPIDLVLCVHVDSYATSYSKKVLSATTIENPLLEPSLLRIGPAKNWKVLRLALQNVTKDLGKVVVIPENIDGRHMELIQFGLLRLYFRNQVGLNLSASFVTAYLHCCSVFFELASPGATALEKSR